MSGDPQLVDETDVLNCLRSKFKGDDFKLESWKLVSMMEDGKLGFLGDHYRIVSSVRQPASAAPREVSFFLKSVPKNPLQLKLVESIGALKKELLFYRLLAKEFAELVGENRGPEFQPFVFPACHGLKENCFMMDDLSPFKFKSIPDGRKGMDLEHIRLTVPTIARFHAASLVMEERHGKRLNEMFPELMFETFFSDDPNHPNIKWHRTSIKLAVDVIPLLEKYNKDPAVVKQIQDALPSLIMELMPSMRSWPNVRNVMNHGDLWVNNIMFRYKDGKPVEVSLVDFQLLRYTSPAHDLLMFMGFCSDRDLEMKHLDELSRLYWDSLAEVLRKAGCDPDKVLPWSDWTRAVEEMKKFQLLQSVIELPLALAPGEVMDPVLVDPVKYNKHFLQDRSVMLEVFKNDPVLHRRWGDALEALIDNYILKK